MQARSAVQCRSARLSEAVSPAKSARVAIGLIVVKSVAKSLLILIKSGDICRSVCFILIRMTYQARAKLLRSASLRCLPLQRFNDSTLQRSLGRQSLGDGGTLQKPFDDRRLLAMRLSVRTHQVSDHALIAGISFTGFALEEFQG